MFSKISVFLLVLCFHFSASAIIPAKLCTVLINAYTGTLTPEELCQVHGASFCQNVGWGEAICRSAQGRLCSGVSFEEAICVAGGGSFCNSVTRATEAVCQISKGSFCSSLDPVQRLPYVHQLRACGVPVN